VAKARWLSQATWRRLYEAQPPCHVDLIPLENHQQVILRPESVSSLNAAAPRIPLDIEINLTEAAFDEAEESGPTAPSATQERDFGIC
jgi:hypothetical protein